MKRREILLAAICAASSSAVAQGPLSIDTTFRMDLPSQNVYSVVVMPNGQLLLSGNMRFPGETNVWPLARINPDGSRDPSFPFTYGGAKLIPWQDRYYVAGSQTVRRLLPNGTLDNSFQHMNFDPYFNSLQGGDYHVYPDGRVLLGGYHTINAPHLGYQGAYNLIWFYNNGRLDTTRAHRTGNGAVFGIREYPAGTAGGLGGRFLIHHWGTTYEGQPVSKVIRIHADGSLDNSFNAPIPWGYIYDMLPLPDGRAYLGGMFRLENQTDTIQLIRVMPDGSLDPTFNNALSFTRTADITGVGPGVSCVLPLGNGLLMATGHFTETDGHARGGICVLDTLGNVVDQYLAGAGCGAYDYPLGMMIWRYASIAGIARAPNGDYYIWGAYHGYSDGTTNDTLQRMVTRLHGGEIGLGVAQASVPTPAMRVYPNPASTQVTVELDALPPNAQLLLRDALGREVHRQRIAGHYTTLQLQHLPNGCYNLEILGPASRIAHQRIHVQH